jgi:hypothetical protein
MTGGAAGWGVSTRDAGLNMAANLSPCSHQSAKPVTLTLTDEVVAAICADCLIELPIWWLHRYDD